MCIYPYISCYLCATWKNKELQSFTEARPRCWSYFHGIQSLAFPFFWSTTYQKENGEVNQHQTVLLKMAHVPLKWPSGKNDCESASGFRGWKALEFSQQISGPTASSTALSCSAKVLPWNWFSKPWSRRSGASGMSANAQGSHKRQDRNRPMFLEGRS